MAIQQQFPHWPLPTISFEQGITLCRFACFPGGLDDVAARDDAQQPTPLVHHWEPSDLLPQKQVCSILNGGGGPHADGVGRHHITHTAEGQYK